MGEVKEFLPGSWTEEEKEIIRFVRQARKEIALLIHNVENDLEV
jgi:hypothetical protein